MGGTSPDFESGLATQVRFLPGEPSSQVGALLTLAGSARKAGNCTLGCALVADAEVPLPEPEGERELVWREGFGWVDRPVEVEQPEVGREVAAA